MIIDTHVHLDQLENLDQAIKNAIEAKVEAIVAMGMDLPSNRKNLELKRTIPNPKIFLAMGMHPAEADLAELEDNLKFIRENKLELCAIGEIGLDFGYKWVRKDEQKREEQRIVFRKHLEMAKELNLPAVIHSRGVERLCLEIAQEIGIKKAEFHWYSGPVDVLKDILAAGYFVSTSPSVAFSPQSRQAMQNAPIEQTLIETDSPVFFNGNATEESFKAEPKDVRRTLKAYSVLKNIAEDKALEILNNNAKRFFNLN